MLNAQATLWSIFGILFISSIAFTAFAQEEQKSDAALPQSQFMQIIDRIDKSKEETRKHVDERFEKLDKKIDELDEKVTEIKTDVAVLNAKVNLLQWMIAIIGAPFLISIIVLFVQIRLNQRSTAERASEIVPESREESDKNIMPRILRDNRPSEPV